ncbi:cyclic nucleotide-binding domain protein (macronuclear) [Tetrahymena thermophila SB210]|uniref:Cyclic nucleotide-binding domain protein n=1 Tax=Tetrahymena thermophila (strain SB210) TaxID=312017 RepID=I7LU70_TETTS|nr:cyclic nucleotide-binding domain protein [Tetrahymena thermophila SB210]EAR90714.1 cyclic nucleotide-binding domain protein [Tetrahymena thermophila SB210]|eukprot:XP_001010959.1 cyclic nucleotide-binding domain protein [Tetrahymena thermophila SB210]
MNKDSNQINQIRDENVNNEDYLKYQEYKLSKIKGRKEKFYPAPKDLPHIFQDFIDIILKSEQKSQEDLQKVINFLGYTQIIQGMEIPNQFYEDFIMMLIPSMKIKYVSKGEVIYKINEEQQQFYILLNGYIDIFYPKSFQEVQNEAELIKQEELQKEQSKKKKRYYDKENVISEQEMLFQRKKNEEIQLDAFKKIDEEKGKIRVFDANGVLLYKKIETLQIKGTDFGYTQKKKAFAIGGSQLQESKATVLCLSLEAVKEAKNQIQEKIDQKIVEIKPFFKGIHLKQTIYNQNQLDPFLYLVLDGEVEIIQKKSPSQILIDEKISKKKNFRYLKEKKESEGQELEEFDQLAQKQQVPSNSVGNTLKIQHVIKLTIYSKGQLFGEEDIFFNGCKRTNSAVVLSQTVTLLKIDYKLLLEEVHVEGYLQNLKLTAQAKLQSRHAREELIEQASNNKLIYINDQHTQEVVDKFFSEQQTYAAELQSHLKLNKHFSEKYLKRQQDLIIANDITRQTEIIAKTSEENQRIFKQIPKENFRFPNLSEHMYPEGTYKMPYDPYLFRLKSTYKIKYKKSFCENNADNQENSLTSIQNKSIPNKLQLILQNQNYSHQQNPLYKDFRALQTSLEGQKQEESMINPKIKTLPTEENQDQSVVEIAQFLTEIPDEQYEPFDNINKQHPKQKSRNFSSLFEEMGQNESENDKNQNKIKPLKDQCNFTDLKKSQSLKNLKRLQSDQQISYYNLSFKKIDQLKQNINYNNQSRYESTGYSYSSVAQLQTDTSQEKNLQKDVSYIKLPVICPPPPPKIIINKKTRSISESSFKSLPKQANLQLTNHRYIQKFQMLKQLADDKNENKKI